MPDVHDPADSRGRTAGKLLSSITAVPPCHVGTSPVVLQVDAGAGRCCDHDRRPLLAASLARRRATTLSRAHRLTGPRRSGAGVPFMRTCCYFGQCLCAIRSRTLKQAPCGVFRSAHQPVPPLGLSMEALRTTYACSYPAKVALSLSDSLGLLFPTLLLLAPDRLAT